MFYKRFYSSVCCRVNYCSNGEGMLKTEMKIQDMETSHISNTINFFLRNADNCIRLIENNSQEFSIEQSKKNANIIYGARFTDLVTELKKRISSKKCGTCPITDIDVDDSMQEWPYIIDGEDF